MVATNSGCSAVSHAARASGEEVMGAVGALRLAVEIPDTRYVDFATRRNWGEDRVYFHDEGGTLCSLPAGWMDVEPAG